MKRENVALLLPSTILIYNGRPITAKIAPFPLAPKNNQNMIVSYKFVNWQDKIFNN